MDSQEERGSPVDTQARTKWKREDIPKAFRGVAARREEFGRLSARAVDKRSQLHRDLETLTVSINAVEKEFQLLSSRLSGAFSQDTATQLERFQTLLARFLDTKAEYDQADDDLRGAEYLLSEYEKRVYDRLATADGPVAPRFNESISSFAFDMPSDSGGDSIDDFASIYSDTYEQAFGRGTTVGELPFERPAIRGMPRAWPVEDRSNQELLPITLRDMVHLDPVLKNHETQLRRDSYGSQPCPGLALSEYVETGIRHHESEYLDIQIAAIARPPFPLLYLSGPEQALSTYLIGEFRSTSERTNRWLLHKLRSSSWEIRMCYLYFQDEMMKKNSRVPDETTWSYLVLTYWSNDAYLDSKNTFPAPIAMSSNYDSGPWREARYKRNSAPVLSEICRKLSTPLAYSTADVDGSGAYFKGQLTSSFQSYHYFLNAAIPVLDYLSDRKIREDDKRELFFIWENAFIALRSWDNTTCVSQQEEPRKAGNSYQKGKPIQEDIPYKGDYSYQDQLGPKEDPYNGAYSYQKDNACRQGNSCQHDDYQSQGHGMPLLRNTGAIFQQNYPENSEIPEHLELTENTLSPAAQTTPSPSVKSEAETTLNIEEGLSEPASDIETISATVFEGCEESFSSECTCTTTDHDDDRCQGHRQGFASTRSLNRFIPGCVLLFLLFTSLFLYPSRVQSVEL